MHKLMDCYVKCHHVVDSLCEMTHFHLDSPGNLSKDDFTVVITSLVTICNGFVAVKEVL